MRITESGMENGLFDTNYVFACYAGVERDGKGRPVLFFVFTIRGAIGEYDPFRDRTETRSVQEVCGMLKSHPSCLTILPSRNVLTSNYTFNIKTVVCNGDDLLIGAYKEFLIDPEETAERISNSRYSIRFDQFGHNCYLGLVKAV